MMEYKNFESSYNQFLKENQKKKEETIWNHSKIRINQDVLINNEKEILSKIILKLCKDRTTGILISSK